MVSVLALIGRGWESEPEIKVFLFSWNFLYMHIFGHRSFSWYYFFIYSCFDIYGAGSIPVSKHKFLPFLNRPQTCSILFKLTPQLFRTIENRHHRKNKQHIEVKIKNSFRFEFPKSKNPRVQIIIWFGQHLRRDKKLWLPEEIEPAPYISKRLNMKK